MKELLKIKRRQSQRNRIAKSMKDLRTVKPSKNKKDALFSLGMLALNYPKLKREGK